MSNQCYETDVRVRLNVLLCPICAMDGLLACGSKGAWVMNFSCNLCDHDDLDLHFKDPNSDHGTLLRWRFKGEKPYNGMPYRLVEETTLA